MSKQIEWCLRMGDATWRAIACSSPLNALIAHTKISGSGSEHGTR